MRRFKIIITLILTAFYPVIFLYSYNIDDIHNSQIMVRPLLFSIVLTFCLFLFFNIFHTDKRRQSLLVSIFSLLFFSFGHFRDYFQTKIGNIFFINLELYIFIYLVVVYVLFYLWIIKKYTNISLLANVFIIFLLCLFISPSLKTFKHYSTKIFQTTDILNFNKNYYCQSTDFKKNTFPDIYYIILDGFARSDILKEIYHYDNSSFIKFLKEKDFYVAEKSTSNYVLTKLSLPSSLNFEYLNPADFNEAILIDKISKNKLISFLKSKCYLFVTFYSNLSFTEFKNTDVDLYLKPFWYLSEFENIFINTTPLSLLTFQKSNQIQYALYKNAILNILKTLPEVKNYDYQKNRPKFIFAHILAPHPPFVFVKNSKYIMNKLPFTMVDNDTNIYDKKEYISYYKEQTVFIEQSIRGIINKILLGSRRPVIIILQSDHGPRVLQMDWDDPDKKFLKERFSILNAYFFYDKNYAFLYSDITPVNTFRVILNQYFSSDIKPLEDIKYFSKAVKPFEFVDVTEYLNKGAK